MNGNYKIVKDHEGNRPCIHVKKLQKITDKHGMSLTSFTGDNRLLLWCSDCNTEVIIDCLDSPYA